MAQYDHADTYIMIVKITEETVYIIGIFHQLEDYGNKLL